jgi:hypothetical protein
LACGDVIFTERPLVEMPICVAGPPVAREAGHSKASVTLDVYSHVLLEEPAWLMERTAGDASVMPSQVLAAT